MRTDTLQVICTFDPALDTERMTVEDMNAYIKTRDRQHVKLRPSAHPTVYVVREIPRAIMFDYVMVAAEESSRAARAFMAGVESVRDLYQDDGVRLDTFRGTGTMDAGSRKIETFSARELERFSPAEVMEVGAAAWYHSFLPRRIDDGLRAPLTSYDLWTRLPFRDAAVNQTSAETSSCDTSAPAERTEPTPGETETSSDTNGGGSDSHTPATAAASAS